MSKIELTDEELSAVTGGIKMNADDLTDICFTFEKNNPVSEMNAFLNKKGMLHNYSDMLKGAAKEMQGKGKKTLHFNLMENRYWFE